MKSKALLVILVLSCTWLSNAQTYRQDDQVNNENNDREILNQQKSLNEIFQTFQSDDGPNLEIRGNSVFLKQVGDFNKAAIVTFTEESEISLEQNGEYNRTGLFYVARSAIADIQQNGDDNVIIDFSYTPGIDISLDLNQEGDGLYFERFGINNLTKSMKFNQTEASPAIIIRSFN